MLSLQQGDLPGNVPLEEETSNNIQIQGPRGLQTLKIHTLNHPKVLKSIKLDSMVRAFRLATAAVSENTGAPSLPA